MLLNSESNLSADGSNLAPRFESKAVTQDLRRAVEDFRRAVRSARGHLVVTLQESREAIREAESRLRR